MHDTFTRVPLDTVRLLPLVNRPGSTPSFSQRAELNRRYVMSLANDHLLEFSISDHEGNVLHRGVDIFQIRDGKFAANDVFSKA